MLRRWLLPARGRMVFLDVASLSDDPLRGVTPREPLLTALARGRTNAQLARDLHISLNTVKFHLENI